MKYVFGTDLAMDKNNRKMDGQIFNCNSVAPDIKEAFQKYIDINTILATQRPLPVWIEVTKWCTFTASCLILWIIVKMISVNGFKNTYFKEPILFYLIAVLMIICTILYYTEMKIRNKVNKYKCNIHQAKSFMEGVENNIDIPHDAIIIEILKFYYIVKNRKMKIVKRGNRDCVLQQVYVYNKNDSLYFTDCFDEWSIPLYCFTGIKK